ncbi:hypothetical protein L208DRAFT_1085689, partial [Tricholoma matsutake]
DNAIAILLNARPHISNASIKDIATQFNLPDLRPALRDYFSGQSYEAHANSPLPFSHLNVWFNLRIQHRSTQDHCVILPPQAVQALPPSSELPFGRCNPILI